MTASFDVIFVADARFEGGASTALECEMKAAVRAGLRLGLLMVKGPLLGAPFPVHPKIRAWLEVGAVQRLDPSTPAKAGAMVIHHPTIFANRPTRPLRIVADRVVLVLHHPAVDREGKRQYDLPSITRNCADAFDRIIELAPVSSIVRDSLPGELPPSSRLLDWDWLNLIDEDEWRAREPRPLGAPIVIGRHSRPDPLKWPNELETALMAYPADRSKFVVKILGAGDFLAQRYGQLPANWELLPFQWECIDSFLHSLDFYVYYHSDEWEEAFGRVILEALAVGLVTILPPHFEPLFGESALYADPAGVQKIIERFAADPLLYAEQSCRARAFVERRHGMKLYMERLRSIGVDGDAATAAVMRPLPDRNVLFVSSNGIGLGHLCQQMALARRLPVGLNPMFATMSYSMSLAKAEGYLTHFLLHHGNFGGDPARWNKALAEEMFDLLAHCRPAVFAYDATAVFGGVIDVLRTWRDTFSIWVRRPMWTDYHRAFLDAANVFDAIVEPGELAEDFDTGPTVAHRQEVLLVSPILQYEPSERLSREDARRALGIDPRQTVVAMQLGSGANFDLSEARSRIISALLEHRDVLVLDIRNPLATQENSEIEHPRLRRTELYPSFRYSRAFDAAVGAAGYNAFHENVLGGVPTLFVPNEAPEMDRQVARARWAEITRRGLIMRRDFDLPFVGEFVERLLDPAERQTISERCASLVWTNGAKEVANYIEDHARLVRTDWDVASAGWN